MCINVSSFFSRVIFKRFLYFFQVVKSRKPQLEQSSSPQPSTSVPPEEDLPTGTGQTDHEYSIASPRKLKCRLDDAVDQLDILKKRLKTSQQQSRRLKRQVESMSTVIEALQERNMISTNCTKLLEIRFSGVSSELFKRLMKKTKQSYHIELRSFAMMLQFDSPKAYAFVRETFDDNRFGELFDHQFDSSVEDNHIHRLIIDIASFMLRSSFTI